MRQEELDKLTRALVEGKEGYVIDPERGIAVMTLPLLERLLRQTPRGVMNGVPNKRLEQVDEIIAKIKSRFPDITPTPHNKENPNG